MYIDTLITRFFKNERNLFTGSWIRHELGLRMKDKFDSLESSEILMVSLTFYNYEATFSSESDEKTD
jgi:hypothetical protein